MELGKHQDRIFSQVEAWRAQEADRASDAGEMRQEIGQLVEDLGINKKALSMIRSMDKMPEEKRSDCLLTLEPLLEMFKAKWEGQSTPDFFEQDKPTIEPDGPTGPRLVDTGDDDFDRQLAESSIQ